LPTYIQTYGTDQLNEVIQQSDYLVVALPLTNETFHFIKQENLKFAKKNQIIINIGRGALIDEDALTEALKDGTVAGAALDVFTVEPLPETSELWELKNVLISSHNADINKHESIRLFTENCKKYVNGEELNCIVNKSAGY
jgi:phosphoglycerate dehydrogenase-like enzyme